jgi:hypothetical protein
MECSGIQECTLSPNSAEGSKSFFWATITVKILAKRFLSSSRKDLSPMKALMFSHVVSFLITMHSGTRGHAVLRYPGFRCDHTEKDIWPVLRVLQHRYSGTVDKRQQLTALVSFGLFTSVYALSGRPLL